MTERCFRRYRFPLQFTNDLTLQTVHVQLDEEDALLDIIDALQKARKITTISAAEFDEEFVGEAALRELEALVSTEGTASLGEILMAYATRKRFFADVEQEALKNTVELRVRPTSFWPRLKTRNGRGRIAAMMNAFWRRWRGLRKSEARSAHHQTLIVNWQTIFFSGGKTLSAKNHHSGRILLKKNIPHLSALSAPHFRCCHRIFGRPLNAARPVLLDMRCSENLTSISSNKLLTQMP